MKILLVVILSVTLHWQRYEWPNNTVGTFTIQTKKETQPDTQWRTIVQGLSGAFTTFVDPNGTTRSCYRLRAQLQRYPASTFSPSVCVD